MYHDIITQKVVDNFIEVAPNDNIKVGHYLLHHAIAKQSLTTHLWIVVNCSAKPYSQAADLQTGQSLTQKLHDALLRFRVKKYAYTADISKAFLRVGLQEEGRNFTKSF